MSSEDGKKPKKKRGFCGCLVAIAAVFLVVVIAGVGVGCYFGNDYLSKNFGISLSDAIGVVTGLYGVDEKKIVNNAPSEADKAATYGAFDDSLFLKNGTVTEQDVKDLLNEVMTDGGEAASVLLCSPLFSDGSANQSGVIERLVNRENADSQKLARFTDEYDYALNYDQDMILELSDRQLMVLLKIAVSELLPEDGDYAEILGNIEFLQVKLSRTERGNAKLDLTVSIETRELSQKYITGNVPSPFDSLVISMVPEKMFATAGIEIIGGESGNDYELSVRINDADESGQTNLYKILGGVLKMVDSTLTGEPEQVGRDYINDLFNDLCADIIDQVDEYMDFNDSVTAEGNFKLDIFKILTKTIYSSSELTKEELAFAYTTTLKTDSEEVAEEEKDSLFVQEADESVLMEELSAKYLIETTLYSRETDGKKEFFIKPVYSDASGNSLVWTELVFDGDEPSEYPESLYVKQSAKSEKTTYTAYTEETAGATLYNKAAAKHLTFEDLAALFGVGTISTEFDGLEIKTLFNSEGLTAKLYGGAATVGERFIDMSRSELGPVITNKMLGALVASQADELMPEQDAFSSAITVKFVKASGSRTESVSNYKLEGYPASADGNSDVARSFFTVGITFDTYDLFGSNGVIASILEDNPTITVTVEVTPEIKSAYTEAPKVRFANLSEARSEKLVEVMEKMGYSYLSAGTLRTSLGIPMKNVFVDMKNMLGDVKVDTNKLILPDVFDLLAKQMFPMDGNKKYYGETIVIKGADLYAALKGLYDVPQLSADGYYISQSADYTTEADKLNNAYGVGLKNDTTNTEKLNGIFAAGGSADIVVSIDESLGKLIGYNNVETEEKMYLTFEFSVYDYLKADGSDMSLLSVEKGYATFEVTKTEKTVEGTETLWYETKLVLDNMSEADRVIVEKIMTYMDSDNETKFARLEREIGVLSRHIDIRFDCKTA